MGFASQVVSQSARFYETACNRAEGAELKRVLKVLWDEALIDEATMEQARREYVTEMILEPIAGLRREDYEVRMEDLTPGTDAEALKTALLLEERDQRFFQDSAARLPLPEVARLFRKAARRKGENVAKLRALANREAAR
ncbi:MAG: hypothetical protein AB1449_12310 [Chloroflexota bacterium]